MGVKEEIAKLTLGQAITVITAPIAVLLVAVLQGILLVVWKRVEPDIAKQTLAEALGLASIIITLLIIVLGVSLFLNFRRKKPLTPTVSEPKMLKQFGVFWDDAQTPHCPVDGTLLHLFAHHPGIRRDDLKCPKCKAIFPLTDPFLAALTLWDAKNTIQERLRKGMISN